ncbi:hypothetical protein [Dyella mobilis]|uniref:Uncharacterized protein n=1 Tax=Dyella mobilis TaxID=1849582 RepID=A0ABS2KKN6_9GAMM|nr:hypothetical protein [Dyella mobilis]MBM7131585.1 hypothetical protein [Dyella mobilis]
MKFEQQLCMAIFMAIVSGLVVLAFGQPDIYGVIFLPMFYAVLGAGILLTVYEFAYAQGAVAQWNREELIATNPIPNWFKLLGVLLLLVIWLGWVMSLVVTRERVSHPNASAATHSPAAHQSGGSQDK